MKKNNFNIMILKLEDGIFPGLYDGSKFVTIRKGHREVPLGLNVMESISGDDKEDIAVYQVTHTYLNLVPDEVCMDDGYEDNEDMYEGMKKFYPDLEPNEEITIIYFDLKNK